MTTQDINKRYRSNMRTKIFIASSLLACAVALSIWSRPYLVATVHRYKGDSDVRQLQVPKLNGRRLGFYNNSQLSSTPRLHIKEHAYAAQQQKKYGWAFSSQSNEDIALYEHYFAPGIQDGVFVEIGALDGITYSNTLFYEKHQNWRGVLIEGHPINAKALRKNRPKAVVRDVAICDESVKSVRFIGYGAVGGDKKYMNERHKKGFHIDEKTMKFDVPCMRMGTLLRQAGVHYVDFFTVDMEGGELIVFQTFDWSIPVGVWLIEIYPNEKEKERRISAILHAHGYVKANWRIQSYCTGDCASNQVWEHPNLRQALSMRRVMRPHPPPPRTMV